MTADGIAQRTPLKDKASRIDTTISSQSEYSFLLTKAKCETIGYSIYKNGHPIIQQNTIPSQSGELGFSDPEKAKKCALLVIDKLKEKNTLPTITALELSLL